MLALLQTASTSDGWKVAAGWGIAILALVTIGVFYLRRFFAGGREEFAPRPLNSVAKTGNPSAFMTASMEGVIVRLREQEKELERLHKMEKERAEKTERLSEEVTRNMPAGLLVVNSTGIISSANPAAEQGLGIRGLGFRRYSEALGEKSELTKLIAECLASGKIYRREQVEHRGPGGDGRRLGVTISPIRRGNEKINGAICLLSDLTELATLQQQVQLKENLAALGELSAGIAHEFKNALATISGYAQMIRGETASPEASDYAERILEQTRNITHVVTEFLKYARPLDISNEAVPLQPLVERVVAEIAGALPQIRIRCEGQFGNTVGDEGLLRQAVLNLTRNAAEASGEAANGGKVLLRGEVVRGDDNGFQRITIYDNGPGIAPAAMAKLFRPFFTTKANGTGLGLAVVQKIVVQHGGQVEARNRPEGGAAFIVTLPLCRSLAEGVDLHKDSA
ncbi:MAG TPA: ATP-binding protein [Candidatus Saccharimonadales bacterium]|nr:ATP-binding protein [Candidatus Saccharimonadales bacterium]